MFWHANTPRYFYGERNIIDSPVSFAHTQAIGIAKDDLMYKIVNLEQKTLDRCKRECANQKYFACKSFTYFTNDE